MPVNQLSSTTLTNAIDDRQTRFVLGSTSGVSGVGSLTTPQSVLVIDDEKCLVQTVPLSGVVEVIRAVDGSRVKGHAAASIVYFGTKDKFTAQTEEGYVGILGAQGQTPVNNLPTYGVPGCTRKVAGKVFVMCDFLATVHSGVTVGINPDFTASVLVSGFQGAVGVVADSSSTSDQWGWVQVYGTCNAQDASATSGITSAYVPIVAGSVSSPNAGLTALVNTTSTPQKYIYNMFITADATTTVTSAVSHTGVGLPVFLNYPYTFAVATDPGLS